MLFDEGKDTNEVNVVAVLVRVFYGVEEDEDVKGLEVLLNVVGEFKINLRDWVL